jgi:hypothetical protein
MKTIFGAATAAALLGLFLIPTATFAQQKTAKACEDEWRANKASNQTKGITEKAYVEKCRASPTTAAPAAPAVTTTSAKPPAPTAEKPAAAKPTTAKPTTPTAAAPAGPAGPTVKPAAKTATATPTGANQFATETLAKAHCPSDIVVWANLDSKIYHFAGNRSYGTTKDGAYMCEKDATTQGVRAAKNEKRPGA